jgi:hypothetical protein
VRASYFQIRLEDEGGSSREGSLLSMMNLDPWNSCLLIHSSSFLLKTCSNQQMKSSFGVLEKERLDTMNSFKAPTPELNR